MTFNLDKMMKEKLAKDQVKTEVKEEKPQSKVEIKTEIKEEKPQVQEIKVRKPRQPRQSKEVPEEQEISMEGMEVILPDVKSDLIRAIHAMLFGKVNHKKKTHEMLREIAEKKGNKALILMF